MRVTLKNAQQNNTRKVNKTAGIKNTALPVLIPMGNGNQVVTVRAFFSL